NSVTAVAQADRASAQKARAVRRPRILISIKVTAALAFCALALSACATAVTEFPDVASVDLSQETVEIQSDIVEATLEQKARIDRLAWPLLVANAELCHERQGKRMASLSEMTIRYGRWWMALHRSR
ncbi:MAG: hypothetical protein AAFV54_16205, partial [Pseudomonadota bacterium]